MTTTDGQTFTLPILAGTGCITTIVTAHSPMSQKKPALPWGAGPPDRVGAITIMMVVWICLFQDMRSLIPTTLRAAILWARSFHAVLSEWKESRTIFSITTATERSRM